MNFYTSTIPMSLAEKLKEKGMPITEVQHDVQGMIYADYTVTYAEVFDWLMKKKEVFITLLPSEKSEDGSYEYEASIMYDNLSYEKHLPKDIWDDAAVAAIEEAITLI